MEKVALNKDLSLSRFVHGLWRLNEWNLNTEELTSLINQCIELGITSFDHADIYGDYSCEEIFGKALKGNAYLRNQMQLITKCGIKLISAKHPDHKIHYYDTRKAHIIHSAETSLKYFHTDRIDLLLIHRPDPLMNPQEVAEAFTKLKKDGKVLNFGVSNFTPKQFSTLQSYLDFDLATNQIEASVACMEHWENGNIDYMLEKKIHPMAWSPLAGGSIFSGNDEKSKRLRTVLEKLAMETDAEGIDQVMYAWLLIHPVKFMPIIGSGKLDRIKTAVDSSNIKLSRMQWFEIWEACYGHEVP